MTARDSSWRGAAVGAVVALAVTSLVACGDEGSPTDDGGRQVLQTGPPRYDEQRVTWAHQRTLHYGDHEVALDDPAVRLAASDVGFFVQQARDRDVDGYLSDYRWVFVDDDHAEELPGDVSHVVTSADGRLAGWIDADGPLRPAGRVAEVVVVDLASGEVVFTDHSGMGGGLGDDLGDRYEELAPTFLGFDADAEHAYWTDAEGSGTRRRVDLATGEVTDASGHDTDEEFPLPTGLVVEAFRGSTANESRAGRALRLAHGMVAPDGDYAVELSDPSRTELFRVSSGRPVAVDFGEDGAQYFLGWLPGDRFYVASTTRRVSAYSPRGPDTIAATLRVCSLPEGRCTRGTELPGLRDLVVPGTISILG